MWKRRHRAVAADVLVSQATRGGSDPRGGGTNDSTGARSRSRAFSTCTERGQRRGSLREPGGSRIQREHVRVAVTLQRTGRAGDHRIEPGARGHLDDATADAIAQDRAG